MNPKDADLLTAAFVYVLRCITEEDTHALQRLGLDPPAMAALSRLSAGDLVRLIDRRLPGHCLDYLNRLLRPLLWL